jgi:hypothetical protein
VFARSPAAKRCATLPPVQPFAESSSWNVSFRNASVNTVMSIGCLPNITDGAGYTATCVENTAAPSANWTVNGSCTREFLLSIIVITYLRLARLEGPLCNTKLCLKFNYLAASK